MTNYSLIICRIIGISYQAGGDSPGNVTNIKQDLSNVNYQHIDQTANFIPRPTTDIQFIPATNASTLARMLRSMDGSKGAGPDGLQPLLFKITDGNVAVPLHCCSLMSPSDLLSSHRIGR